jgi:hypothetical protein
MPVRDEDGEAKHYGLYPGLVVDNLDPKKRGRVKVEIPGLCEPSTDWALPIGGSHSSGVANRGGFDPPKKDAAVIVAFLDGDIDHPVYLGGWRATDGSGSDAPTIIQGKSVADAIRAAVYETDSYAVVVDESSSPPELSITHKSSGSLIRVLADKIEVVCGDRTLRVKDKKIQLGAGADEAIVKGTKWWRDQDQELTAQIAGLQAVASSAMYGPAASLVPGLMQVVVALQQFQLAGAAEAFLSKVSFTE